MCKSYGKTVDKLRIFLGKNLYILVEKFLASFDAWKTDGFSTNFYQEFSQVISRCQLWYFSKLSTLSTPFTAATKLKKGIV
jgi:hypothetical protein